MDDKAIDPSAARSMKALLDDAASRAASYLDSLAERRVAPAPGTLDAASGLGGPLPEAGREPMETLEVLDRLASPATIASAGPRYFGFVTGGALPAALAANWLAGAWDQNAFSVASSPLGARLEAVTVDWLVQLLALPAGTGAAVVTGATMANFTALAAARRQVLARAGWDVEADGLFGAPPITVVVGAEAHATLFKALGMLGLGRQRVVTVPADDQGRIVAASFPAVEGPAIACLQAGNVNTGAFDPAAEIIDALAGSNAWVHVDGAFGLWAAAAPDHAHLMRGFERADSWAVDAHKWLNVPYDCGLALVRDPAALSGAMSIRADYLVSDAARDPFDFTPESSRRMRAVEIWAAIVSLGRAGIADLVTRNCRMARRFAAALDAAGHEILNEVVLNQVLVSFGSDSRTRTVIEAVQADGTCWCSGSRWRGRDAMRISVSSWATTDADVERSLGAILRIAADRSLPD